MIRCSNCSRPYPFKRFLLVVNLFRLRCPHCQAVLRGGRDTRRICIWMVLAGVVLGAFGVFLEFVLGLPSPDGLYVVLGGSVILGTIAGLLVWWRGDYEHEKK